jgi:alpha-glucosidase (family GH31 glycosyl hydrolase)
MYSANFTGGSLVYPLFFDHPSDDKTLDYIEDSFMLGDSIYVCPVLDAYSPDGQF